MKTLNWILAALLIAALPARADTIVVRGKPAISGVKVTAESYKEVSYTQGGKKLTIPAGDVLEVIFDRRPINFRLGFERYNLGDFVEAASRLALAVDEGTDDQRWVKEYALFYLGKAQLASGQYQEAANTLEKMIKLKADSRLYPEATLALARARTLSGSHDEAQKLLKALGDVIDQNKIGGNWAERVKVARAEALLDAGKCDPAAELVKEVYSALAGGKSPFELELAMHAKSIQLEAYVQNEDLPKAKFVIEDLQKASSGGDAAAQAAYRNARAAMVLVDKAPSSEDLLNAAYDLARVRSENFTVVSELPRTCYLLGLIHLKLDGTLAKAKDLAKSYFDEARRRFPESRQAVLAREKLKSM
ncbi:MAG: tetratricopeptide repeat protein [Planctomycetes bacterium]|nr:tetratricopeptide repeat protein [Planctomycetota bacterium]